MSRSAAGSPELTGKAPAWSRADVLFLVVITCAAFVLRLIGHAQQSFWTDEVESIKLVTKPGVDALYVVTRNYHGSLHKTLLVGWTALFGNTDASARMLSVVLGTGTVALLHVWGRRWLGEVPARWCAVFLAINPFHIWYSQEVRGYALLIGIGMASLVALDAELRRRSLRSAVLLGLSMFAACLSSFGGLFLFAIHGVLVLAAARGGYPVRRFLLTSVAVLVCLAPYVNTFRKTVDVDQIAVVGEVEETERLRGSHTFSPLAPAHSLYAYSVGITLGPSIDEMHRSLTFATFRPYIPVIAATAIAFGVLAILGVGAVPRRGGVRAAVLVWLLVPIAATALLAVLNIKVYNVRYPAVGFVPWVVLLGCGAAAIRPVALRGLLAGGAIALSILSYVGMRTDARYWRPDARAAAALLLEEGRPGDRVILYSIATAFEYYYEWRGEGAMEVQKVSGWELATAERREELRRRILACDGRIWLVRYRSWYVDPHERFKRELDERLEHLGSWRFPDLPVDLYACPDSTQPS